MKKFLPILLTAFFTSIITLLAFHYLGFGKPNVKMFYNYESGAKQAMYTMNKEGEIVPLDFRETSKKVMDAVVHIKSMGRPQKMNGFHHQNIPDPFRDFFDQFFQQPSQPDNRGYEGPIPMGTGSGVIINSEGYIVTNNHVIDNAEEIEVTLHDNRTYKAQVIGTDPSTDLALIQIKEKELVYLPFSNSDNVEVGEWVLAVGNPFNLNSTVTAGIVSAKGRNINILRDKSAIESFIQTDAAINPGNSGGALVNLNGELIGINTAIASPTGAYTGYGFAVPSNIVSKIIEDLLKFGIVQRGFLGVIIRSVDANLAKEEELNVTNGVFVDSLADNSAAKAAGIKKGDVIIELNGNTIKSAPELQEMVGRHRPGDQVSVKVNRKGEIKTFNVTLFNKDGKKDMLSKEKFTVLTSLGADFEDLDSKTAKKLDIIGGVKVKNIKTGKLRKYTDIRDGFIITKVNNKEVNSVEEMVEVLENSDQAVLLEGIYENIPGKHYFGLGLE